MKMVVCCSSGPSFAFCVKEKHTKLGSVLCVSAVGGDCASCLSLCVFGLIQKTLPQKHLVDTGPSCLSSVAAYFTSLSLSRLSPVCSGAISSRYTPIGQRPLWQWDAQRGPAEGPPGEGGPAGGGGSSTNHQRGSQHPPPGEMHAGSGSPHHR